MDPEIIGGIAGGAVTFLLEKFDNFVKSELRLQEKIRREAKNLERELLSIEALLKDSFLNKANVDNTFTVWIGRVRDQAYDIEDVLDMFSLDRDSPWRRFKSRHLIDDFIRDVKQNREDIQEIKKNYGNVSRASISSSSASTSRVHTIRDNYVRVAPRFMDTADVVGIEEPTNKLTSWVLDPKRSLEVMFVVGMGGLGKTTLVHTVYENVKHHFHRHVWIDARQYKTKLDVLTRLVEEFGCPITQRERERADVSALIGKLRQVLLLQRTSSVIVFDDLWVKEVWDSVTLAFPNGKENRIIITTRRGDIANSCGNGDSVHIYNLPRLSPDGADQLFRKKAFRKDGACPPSLEEVFKSFLQKCDGLPLGIVETGRLLSITTPNKNEWKLVHDSLVSELRSGGRLSSMMEVLSASYKDLPYHLKYCFLYMSIFPENYEVRRRRLVRLWIAEGFVKKETGKTPEEVGKEYLKELIDRNLIRANELDFDGLPKNVGVHSLMLKMILAFAHEENFCTIVTCTETPRKSADKTRRLSIHRKDHEVRADLPCLRSLFNFGKCKLNTGYSFKLLKVLDIGGTSLEKFPSGITDLRLLRYLSLRNTKIQSIPWSLSKLLHLETLDLKETWVTEVPAPVLQLKQLRHLLVYRYDWPTRSTPEPFDTVKGFKAPKRISEWKNLQSLSYVKASLLRRMAWPRSMIQGLENLSQLRKLGVVELAEDDGPSLCRAIDMMTNLRSLSLTSLNMKVPLKLDEMTSPPALLQRLYLKGQLQKIPSWISSLHDLIRVRLKWSSLAENPITALQGLPRLVELQLLHAYTGAQLEFKSETFLQLQILDLQQLGRLSSIVMEQGTLPCLQKLIISHCELLMEVPGIDQVHDLQELLLYEMPDSFLTTLRKKNGRLPQLVRHIPRIYSCKQEKWESISG